MPYNFATNSAAKAFHSTIRVITKTWPEETLSAVVKQLRSDLIEIESFWETLRPKSQMLKTVLPTSTISFSVNQPWSDGPTPTAAFTSKTVPIPSSLSGAVSYPAPPPLDDQNQISSITTITTNTASPTKAASLTSTKHPDLDTRNPTKMPASPPTSESSIENAKALQSIAASISQSLNILLRRKTELMPTRTHNNLSLATKFLLASPVLVQCARDEEATAATAPAAAPSASADQPATTEEPSTSQELIRLQTSVFAPALLILSAGNELASNTTNVLMGEVLTKAPRTVEAQGSTNVTTFKVCEKRSVANDNKPFDGITTLLSDLKSLSTSTDVSKEDPPQNNIFAMSVRLRMLALLTNNPSFKVSLHRNANTLLKTIVAVLCNATGLMNKLLEAREIPNG
ncbi:hypothetical protein KEM48_003670 [Puccinia striiformis f. sp. tritici PST-130]|nr:hypothetical protein KEM48_003670 [Puccinia striiformis f. sp. tritici PST-130]